MNIAALVLGIVGLVISLVPCLGMYALPATVLAVILGAIGIKKATAGKGMAIAGLVMGLIGTAIGAWQIRVYMAAKSGLTQMSTDFKKGMDDLKTDLKNAEDGGMHHGFDTGSAVADDDAVDASAWPAGCQEYNSTYASMGICDAVTSDAVTHGKLKQTYDLTVKTLKLYSTMAPDAQKGVVIMCKNNNKAVAAAVTKAGC